MLHVVVTRRIASDSIYLCPSPKNHKGRDDGLDVSDLRCTMTRTALVLVDNKVTITAVGVVFLSLLNRLTFFRTIAPAKKLAKVSASYTD